ncbi:formimidoylglutamase [Hahella sp. HN01]|nr:formimidoylglutamase [Hahella sp. HN01]
MEKFTMSEAKVWSGRIDSADGPTAVRWHQQVRAPQEDSPAGVSLIGYPCDLGVYINKGRVGAANGPDEIIKALANLPWRLSRPVYDCGNIKWEGELEDAQAALANKVFKQLQAGHNPIVLGGGHDVAWGSFQGLRRHLDQAAPDKVLGILNLDAHFDLRSDSEGASSGTPFQQIAKYCKNTGKPFHYAVFGISEYANTQALFDRADKLGVTYLKDTHCGFTQLGPMLRALDAFMSKIDCLYLTIDLDVLPAATAPGVSAPAACGVPLEIVEAMLDAIQRKGLPVLMADIAEYNPTYDIDSRTARVAARLAARLAGLLGKPTTKA